MSDLELRDHSQPCKHGRTGGHYYWIEENVSEGWCDGGKKIVMRQLYEPQESHREHDNELVATWGFGAGADAEIPPIWVEVDDG